MSPLLGLSFALLFAVPQEPPEIVARYRLIGADTTVKHVDAEGMERPGVAATVTRTDLALEMAFHLRRRDRGRQAVEQIVDVMLTRNAAQKQGLMPTRDEVLKFWEELQRQLRAAGREPSEFPAVRNSGEKQWLDDLAVQLAQERVVRAALGLGKDEQVSGEMMKLWVQEQRKATKLVTDPDQLPVGTALRVEGVDVPMIDLGMLLLRTADDDERDRFVRQCAYLSTLEKTCADEKIEVTPADLDAAIEQRRAEAAKDPRYQGATFDSMLEAQGLTAKTLRDQRTFRGALLLEKLGQKRFSDRVLAEELAKDRDAVLAAVGPRRKLGVIFVNAMLEPNQIVKRDFAAAMAHVATLRRLLDKETFANVAALESEHGPSRQKGGDIGWHRRNDTALPEPVLAAAFALAKDAVSEPVRADDGCYLVKVLDVEPVPSDAELLRLLREQRSQALGSKMLADAAIQIGEPRKKKETTK
ncbi:MAG: peptidylprolyl isomerase [Planctomycetota bacterium]|jgi:hypothetical protein